MIFVLALHLILLLWYTISVWKVLMKTGWSTFSYSSVYIIIFYLLAPIISLGYFVFFKGRETFAYNIPDLSDFVVIFFCFTIIVIGIVFFWLGYSRTKGWNIIAVTDRTISGIRVSTLFAFILLLMSVLGMFFYVSGVGSFAKAVEIANLIRAGVYVEEERGDTSYTFYYRFMFLAIIPFWYCFYDSRQLKSKARLILFPISLIILILTYIYLSSGRQSIINIFLLLLLSSLIKKNKILDIKFIVFVVVAFLALPILTAFFLSKNVVTDVGTASFINVFVKEFGFPYYSLIYSVQETHSFYYFSDFIDGLFGTFLPSSFNPGLEGVNYLNTYYMMGVWTKWVPPGIFAMGYYSLGVVGVILTSFLTGRLFKIIDVFFRSLITLRSSFIFFYVFFILNTLGWIRTGLPHNYFYHMVNVCFVIFIFSSFIFTKKRNSSLKF